MQLAESDRRAHDSMARRSDVPAARAGDLRDQAVDVEAVEKSADLRTLLCRVVTELARELGAEVAVGEAVHRMLPAHEGDEELGIGPGHGIESLARPPGMPHGFRARTITRR